MNNKHTHHKIPKWTIFILISSFLTTIIGIWWGMNYEKKILTKQDNFPHQTEYEKIARVYELISNNYVEVIQSEQLTEGAIKGMLTELDDPYSTYLTKDEAKKLSELLDSSFQGIGAEISDDDGKIIIISPLKNSPAERSGLRSQDEIVTINNEKVNGKTINEVIKLIRGEKNSTVEITVLRKNSSKPLTFTVKREKIPVETVHASIEKHNNKNIGIIAISQFSENTGTDFKKALTNLEKKHITGLLIDVRGNPGGLLSSVEEVLNYLLPPKTIYVKIQDRNQTTESFYTKEDNKKNYPIAVLIDEGSASASEILAAALKEAQGYNLIGEKTFGKGTVQQAVALGDGSEVKMTFFKWLTPGGTWIHKEGIKPTIHVKQPAYFNAIALNIDTDLKLNGNDDNIKTLQNNLNYLGFITGRNDGYFDKQTEKAVMAFQHESKLPVTGIFNKQTATLLNETIINMVKDEKNDLQKNKALQILTK